MLDAIRHRCGVVGLHRQLNQIEMTFDVRRIAREIESSSDTIAEQSADAQAVARDRLKMIRTPEQRDLVAGAAQHRADDRSDRTCARNQNWPLAHRRNNIPAIRCME